MTQDFPGSELLGPAHPVQTGHRPGQHVPEYQKRKDAERAAAPAREAAAKAEEERRRQGAIGYQIEVWQDRLAQAQAQLASREHSVGPAWAKAEEATREYHVAKQRLDAAPEADLAGHITSLLLCHDRVHNLTQQLATTMLLISKHKGAVALFEFEIAAVRNGGDSTMRYQLEYWASTGYDKASRDILPGSDFFMNRLDVPPGGTPQAAILGERAAAAQDTARRALGVKY